MADILEVIIQARDEASRTFADVGKAADDAGKKAEGWGDKLSSAGSRATSFGNKMSLGVTAPLALLGGISVDAASDTAESMSKVETVFGDAADSVKEFTNTSAKNLGLSQQKALEAAGTYGNLFTAMGMGQQPAAEMSTELLQLSADLASFNNLSPEEVLEKLRSGLVGETEPLRALGVNMNEARIKAEAYALGLVQADVDQTKVAASTLKVEEASAKAAKALKEHGAESTEYAKAQVGVASAEEALEKALAGKVPELDAAQKAQAAYSIIMKDTATAQGDFARTSDGLANSTRTVKAQAADLQAEMGEKMLPVMLRLTDAASGALDVFSGLSPEIQTGIVAGVGMLAVIGPLSTAFGTAASVAGALTKATWLQNAAQVALNLVMSLNPIGIVVLALAALTAAFVLAWQNSETFRTVVTGVFEGVRTAVVNAINGMIGMINGLIGALNGISIDVPDWLGGGTIGFNVATIPTISTYEGGEYKHSTRNAMEFAEGGLVPGPIGAPVAATVHGGEYVIPAGQPLVTINANIANREDVEALAYRVAQIIKGRQG